MDLARSSVRFSATLVFAAFIIALGATAAVAEVRPVATVTVNLQDSYQAKRLFAGRVLGSKRSVIGFELKGLVESVSVDDGDFVAAGAELARLDTEGLQIEKAELEAGKREVLAQLEQLRRDLARFETLSEKGYVSAGQLDDLKSNITATEARQKQVEQRLRGVSLRLEKSVLRAPFAGEIAGLKVEEGAVVEPGIPALELVEVAENEALFGIPGELAQQLVIGQDLEVFGEAGQRHGAVISIARNLDWRTQTRMVRISLPAESPFVDGQTAYALIPEQRPQPGFWLPKQALLEDMRGTWAVYQLAANEAGELQIVKRSVRVLYQYQGQVFVDAELKDGDLLVSGGIHKLAPGQLVRPAKGLSSLNMTESLSGYAQVHVDAK
ncbi:efflux RND transporter periplasmic adaptor subunit [Spongiibacter sp. KMU-158]|uniref:Efflux RND transporter periplasmic adaptor subunit n=1 Tax=Spongiibacter pelagi TaxID=2760804 RepID=A0A927C0L6_9GAMM|nr:efflux RND transporter periplasmic adaptor subunit [Spongiibacter pelagi]MBD2859063.1 efflux RND transporter periplasmic adaptor subunit [Spongiibacter pelagi]